MLDDEASNRRFLGRALERLGHRYELFSEPRALESACRLRPPDVVLSDIGLGATDGVAYCLILRVRHPEVRFVLMTGDPGNRERASAGGFATVLLKPFSLEQLSDALGG